MSHSFPASRLYVPTARFSLPLLNRSACLEGSLCSGGEHGLKIGTLFFPRDYADIDVLEAGVFEQLVQLHFTETEPVIGVKLARPLERMAQQIRITMRPFFLKMECALLIACSGRGAWCKA